MTISSTTRIAGPYTGTGLQAAFPFGFKVFQVTDVLVTLTDTSGNLVTQTLTSQYTVTLNANQNTSPGGTVNMVTPPPAGYTLVIGSQVPALQPADLTNAGNFYPQVINDALDRLTVLIQQAHIGSAISVPEITGVPTLPAAATRANTQMLFDSQGNPYCAAPVSGSAADVLLQLANTVNNLLGDALIGVKRTAVGAVAANLHNWIEGQVINLQADFGADPTGAVPINTALTFALATGKNVYIGDGNFSATTGFTVSTANQRVFGNGWSSRINFSLAASAPAFATTNATGWQVIEGLYLNGVSNCSKMISIGSPDCSVLRNWIVNATAGGHGVYGEDENTGAGTYVFDARIEGNLIYGALGVGTYGIRLGTNHQGSKVLRNSVQNWGWHLGIVGATSLTTVQFNIFQRCDTTGATPAAIIIHKAGSGMPVYNVDIANNYFEQNLVELYVDDCAPLNLAFHKNYCYRNTTSALNSAIYKTGTGTSAAAARIQVYDNYCDGFQSVFSLNNQYAANLTRTDNNTVAFSAAAYSGGTAYVAGNSVTSGGNAYVCIAPTTGNAPPNATYWALAGYATGTYASSAYTIRQINTYFGGVVLASGAFSSQSVTRQEFATTTANVNFRWERGEYLEFIQVSCTPSAGSPTMTLALHQVTGNTDNVIATTGSVAASGLVTLPVNAFPQPNCHYYLSDAGVAGGGTSYRYPYQAWIR